MCAYDSQDQIFTSANNNIFLLTLGMIEETRQIQLTNRIKFSSHSLRSIEHKRVKSVQSTLSHLQSPHE